MKKVAGAILFALGLLVGIPCAFRIMWMGAYILQMLYDPGGPTKEYSILSVIITIVFICISVMFLSYGRKLWNADENSSRETEDFD